ncbi:MAG: hypothetical protein EA424_28150 [Planctomycetaceae bacterium]|nr:MAG: hypothetical protein EA424_28150 [Planctomycetaceae bacterium]
MPSKSLVACSTLLGAACALAVVAVAGWLVWQETVESAEDEPVRLVCGTSMAAPMEELIAVFQRQENINVEAIYGASDRMMEQLAAAPDAADLFLPGEPSYVERAKAAGLVDRVEVVAWLVPAILVRAGNPREIGSLADLARPGLRVAMPAPASRARGCRLRALGRVMAPLLENHGLTPDDIEPNVVFRGTTGHELGSAVELGRADAAMLWDVVARRYASTEVVSIPEDRNLPVPVKLGVLAHARRNTAARAFLEFLHTQTAREILHRHHYHEYFTGKDDLKTRRQRRIDHGRIGTNKRRTIGALTNRQSHQTTHRQPQVVRTKSNRLVTHLLEPGDGHLELDVRLRPEPPDLVAHVDRHHRPSPVGQLASQRETPRQTAFLVVQPRATTRLDPSVLLAGDEQDQFGIRPIDKQRLPIRRVGGWRHCDPGFFLRHGRSRKIGRRRQPLLVRR